MNGFTYALQRIFRAIWPEPERPTLADNVATAFDDEEQKQHILRMIGRQVFGCEVAVYKHQRPGDHVEYVIVVLENTPYYGPSRGVPTVDDVSGEDWPGDDAP